MSQGVFDSQTIPFERILPTIGHSYAGLINSS